MGAAHRPLGQVPWKLCTGWLRLIFKLCHPGLHEGRAGGEPLRHRQAPECLRCLREVLASAVPTGLGRLWVRKALGHPHRVHTTPLHHGDEEHGGGTGKALCRSQGATQDGQAAATPGPQSSRVCIVASGSGDRTQALDEAAMR